MVKEIKPTLKTRKCFGRGNPKTQVDKRLPQPYSWKSPLGKIVIVERNTMDHPNP